MFSSKKKRTKEREIELNESTYGIFEKEEEIGAGKKKKKENILLVKKETLEIEEEEVISKKKNKLEKAAEDEVGQKKRTKKREIEPNASINIVFEKEEEIGARKKKRKENILPVKRETMEIEEEEVINKRKNKLEKAAEDEECQKKKSKQVKKRRQDEEEANVNSNPKKKMKSSSTTTTTTARPIKEELKIEVVDENIVVDLEVDNGWPVEVTKQLLSHVRRIVSNQDNRSARVSLKSVDWEAVAIPGCSPKVCQEHFMALYKKINPYKNLKTVVDEMMKKMEMSGGRDYSNRPLMPISRFFKDFFTPEVTAEIRRNGASMCKAGHQAWKDLPAEQKEKYIRPYQQECSELKQSVLVKKKPTHLESPKLPFKLCWESEKEAAGTQKKRTYYASLPPYKQLPYIRKALEDVMKYETDLQSHMAAYPDYQPPSYQAVPKIDLKTYLDECVCPAQPPIRAFLVFYRELVEDGQLQEVPGRNRMVKVMKQFKDLCCQKQTEYREKMEQGLLQYEEQLNEWSSRQDKVTLYALKKYREMVPFSIHVRQKTTRHVKADQFFPHKVSANISCPKFLGEPSRPPASPYVLFTVKFRTLIDPSLSGPETQRALKDGWKVLSEEDKTMYIARCRSLHQGYEKELKAFVREMNPKTRKLFLGFHRVTLFRFFGNRDVFAKEFPHSEKCPVLVKGMQDPHHPANPCKLFLEEDDENEEEDDMMSATTSPVKERLSPVLFSDLMAPPSPFPKMETHPDSEDEIIDIKLEGEEQFISTLHSPAPYTSQAKKKAPVPSKKSKALLVTPTHESEDNSSEEEEEAVSPAWHSGSSASLLHAQPKKQKQQHDSSSSGSSDSDSS